MWPIKIPYIIIELFESVGGDQYEHAVGACPSKSYCWIFSRSPTISSDLLEEIRRRLVNDHHFDISDLETVQHAEK